MSMKSVRYDEAAERNLSNAERRKNGKGASLNAPYAGNGPVDYKGKKLEVAKTLLGIRKDDDRFDARIAALIKG